MRIRRIQLVGLAAAMIGAGAGAAQAEDLTISTATTTPVSTSDPVAAGPVAAGNVTIASGGSITLTSGAAITVDSANTATTQSGGSILSNNSTPSVTGILITNAAGGAITHGGTITLTEDNYTLTDSNNDGNLDGEFALGSNRDGIDLTAAAAIASLTSTGAITIEGDASAAMRLSGQINGVLDTSSALTVTGDGSYGIYIGNAGAGGVTGNALIRGGGAIRGVGSEAIVVDGLIGGELRVNGAWTTTGYHSTTVPADQGTLTPSDDLLQNGSVLNIHASVAGGVLIEGTGVFDDPDDDLDTVTETGGDTNDDVTASLRSFGSAPAVQIQATTGNIVLGDAPGPGAFGLNNRGIIGADTLFNAPTGDLSATAVRIAGTGAFSSVDLGDGFANDGSVIATAHEGGTAFGVSIGQNTIVDLINNRGTITSTVISDSAASTAYGVFISGVASAVPGLSNSGTMLAQIAGEDGDAVVIFDQSGSLQNITNTGTIQALHVVTDDNLTDNITPVVTGADIAIDVSNATAGVTLTQTGYGAELPLDDDIDNRPDIQIIGDILLSDNADIFNLEAGSVTGDLSFGDGADTFNISGGATYQGVLSHGAGALTIDVSNGTLGLSDGTAVTILDATFGDGSAGAEDAFLDVSIDPLAVTPLIAATGTVTFDTDSRIRPIAPEGLVEIATPVAFLTAATLNGAANVTGPITGDGISFIYDVNITQTNPNTLAATFEFKSATDLGLTTNQAIAFDPIIEALRLDDDATNAILAIDNAGDFANAYEDLMPSYASASTELAATAIQQMQSATTNRLAATRLHDLDDVSVWAQEIGYGLTRDPSTPNGQEFRGYGFGLAAGIDGPLQNGGLFGISASFLATEAEEPGRPEGEISSSYGQLNAYWATAVGPIDLDIVGGVGVGKLQSRRFVEIGDDFSAQTEADWWSYEGHGAVRASAPLRMADWMIITPQAALTYVILNEQGYTEEGGGPAIDLDVSEATSQRLWGDLGVEFSARLNRGGNTVIAPRIFAGYRANLIDEEAERDFRFVSGTQTFTLADEGFGDGGPLVGIGIDASNGYSTFSLGYEGEFGDQIERHSLNAAIRFRF